jgi:2-polyprenyl-3-methyl-5-hydroxy-6-metoxy-1,4-benzoquinol methylase
MEKRLIVCIMGQNCQKFLPMCLESVKEADSIVFCDGGTEMEELFFDLCEKFGFDGKYIKNKFDQDDKGMNGKQRNFYLNYLKENYPNDWALCLDADEVVEDLGMIKEWINHSEVADGVYSVKMRHFQQDLGHEDATTEKHYVPHRLFKISESVRYPEVEHSVLIPKSFAGATDVTTIWHLAYIPNLWDIKKRYDNHLKKSNIHTPEFLKWWYFAHLFGTYPKKQINIKDIPPVILKEFGIDPDEIYFADRNIEIKHPVMVKQWYDYFEPRCVLDLGCGRGPYMYFWRWFLPNKNDVKGIEKSRWAVDHALISGIICGDVSDPEMYNENWDLITCIDILEHLEDSTLLFTLKLIAPMSKNFLFSIPFVGDPNLLADKTHKQFKTKEEWIKLIESYGIKIKETPKDWLFANQILIGEKT